MKIAFLTRKSPYDKRSWSGAFFSIYEKLRINNYVEWVRPLDRGIGYKLILTFLANWYKYTNGKKLNIVNEIYATSTISSITKELNKNEYDIIFAAASPELIANLETRIPVLYFLDATFKQLAINYPSYSNLPKWNFKQGLKVEKAALHRADHIVVSSLWTKNSIIEDFHINPKKYPFLGLVPI